MTLWRLDRDMPIEEIFLRGALEEWREEQQNNG